MEKFYCDGQIIRDEHGRQRIFRGVNICVKKDVSADEFRRFAMKKDIIDSLKSIGANIVRLGITWSKIESTEGKFNDEIIYAYKEFIKKCGENGIYILLDMHQDLFSEYFYGNGAPKWAVDKSIKSEKPFAIWAEGYFYMDGVQKAFSDFWNNKNGLLDKFINAWRYLAERLNDCVNIIGLDYLNEPYVDKNGRKIFLNIVKNIYKTALGKEITPEKYFELKSDKAAFALMALKIASAVKTKNNLNHILNVMDSKENFASAVKNLEKFTVPFNREYYQPFFDKISNSVKTKSAFGFFEHNYYSNLGIPFEITAGESCIYSPHIYDIFIDSPLYNNYSSNNRVQYIIDVIRENQIKMNVPVVVGEWGGDSQKGTKWIEHIDYVMTQIEKNQWSSIYWSFNFSKNKLINVFNRPFPVAVCGKIKEIHTETGKKKFRLVWEQEAFFENKNVKTEIYVPHKGIVEYNGITGENVFEIEY